MMKYCGLLALSTLIGLHLNAALEWDSRTVRVDLKPDDSFAAATYTFKNTGDAPVTILEATVSCSCVVINDIKGTYAKGQGGTIKARYSVGNTIGSAVEHIQLKTSDSGNPETLRLTVNIPVLYKLYPLFAFWAVGEETVAKEITFFDLSGTGIKPVQVYSTDENITATLLKGATPDRYTIRLQPKSTAQAVGSNVYVDIDLGKGAVRKVKILAAVHDPADAKGRIHIKN